MPNRVSNSTRLPLYISIATAGLAAAIATVVLIGWQTRNALLTSLGGQGTFMAPGSAVLLILGTVAVWLAQPPFRHWSTNVLSRALGAVVFVWGILICLEYATGLDLLVDRLVYLSRLDAWNITPYPGRISIQATVAFTLMGASILLLDLRVRRLWLHEALAGIAFLMAFLGIVGHGYSVQPLYGVMAFHTAIAIALLAIAIILTRPANGFAALFFSTNPAGVALRRTLLTSIITLTLFGYLVLRLQDRFRFSHEAAAAILVLASVLFVGALLIRTGYALLAMERDREATRRALFESEAKYRSLFENTAEGIALYEPVLDSDGKPADWIIRDANPTFLAAAGRDRSVLIGHRLTELFGDKAQYAQFFETAQEMFASRKARQFESYFAPLNRHYIISFFPIDERLFASTTIDVTKSKEAERQVRESEARYRRLIETANEGIWMLDNDMRIVFLNERMAQLLGHTREEMLGHAQVEFVYPEDIPFVQNLFEGRRRGRHAHVDLRMRHNNGSERWLMMAAAPVYDAENRFIGALDMFTDVTDRRAAVQALRESEERFRELADSMPQMVWTATADGWMDYANRRWTEYTGLNAKLPRSAEWTAAVHPNDSQLVSDGWHEALRSAREYSAEARMLRQSDAIYRWHLIRVIPVFDSEARVSRWYGTCTDIHEKRLAEEAMMKSEKLAATGRLAATIAHEINNPLEAVTNLIFLAQNSGIDEQGREFLELASDELKRVAHITKQTLGFYRETASPARMELGATVESVLTLYERKIESKDIHVSKQLAPDVYVEAIPGEIRQVLSNLISNAIDALDQGGTMHIRVRPVGSAGEARGARIVIADDGVGIPEQIRQQVFEPFFTTKRDFGTGLGLWVTRQIMRRHSGNIRVRSCTRGPHRGTIFSVFLPASAAQTDVDAQSKVARV